MGLEAIAAAVFEASVAMSVAVSEGKESMASGVRLMSRSARMVEEEWSMSLMK